MLLVCELVLKEEEEEEEQCRNLDSLIVRSIIYWKRVVGIEYSKGAVDLLWVEGGAIINISAFKYLKVVVPKVTQGVSTYTV